MVKCKVHTGSKTRYRDRLIFTADKVTGYWLLVADQKAARETGNSPVSQKRPVGSMLCVLYCTYYIVGFVMFILCLCSILLCCMFYTVLYYCCSPRSILCSMLHVLCCVFYALYSMLCVPWCMFNAIGSVQCVLHYVYNALYSMFCFVLCCTFYTV